MTHYSPGAGLTKPLNQIEGPVYPDIKKGPPRFVWSRKHWRVDAGATIRELEPYTKFFEPAILAQSRDYNKRVYGQSSHREIVNAEFRPPLVEPWENIRPINRIPCTTQAIVPHVNPGGGDYRAKNERINNVESALTDRIEGGQWRPTFYAPMSLPEDNSVLPDLETKLPSVSVTAGWKMPSISRPSGVDKPWSGDPTLTNEKTTTPLDAGWQTDFRANGPTGLEDLELYDSRPQVSAGAGYTTSVRMDGDTGLEGLELYDSRPQVSVGAGYTTSVRANGDTGLEDLILDDNRPQVSAGAGYTTSVRMDGDTGLEGLNLEQKQGHAAQGVLNPNGGGYTPGVEDYEMTNVDQFINENRPSVSYTARRTYGYRDRNSLTARPHYRKRLQPEKSYGQISQSGGVAGRMRSISRPQMSGLMPSYDTHKAGKMGFHL